MTRNQARYTKAIYHSRIAPAASPSLRVLLHSGSRVRPGAAPSPSPESERAPGNMAERAEYDRWYKTARWQRLRAEQLRREPVCAMCLPRCVPASICDHVEPHRGDHDKFWSGPFQSLCKPCHDSVKQRIEKGGKPKPTIGVDGWPAERECSAGQGCARERQWLME